MKRIVRLQANQLLKIMNRSHKGLNSSIVRGIASTKFIVEMIIKEKNRQIEENFFFEQSSFQIT